MIIGYTLWCHQMWPAGKIRKLNGWENHLWTYDLCMSDFPLPYVIMGGVAFSWGLCQDYGLYDPKLVRWGRLMRFYHLMIGLADLKPAVAPCQFYFAKGAGGLAGHGQSAFQRAPTILEEAILEVCKSHQRWWLDMVGNIGTKPFFLGFVPYPLVNCPITMENHHF